MKKFVKTLVHVFIFSWVQLPAQDLPAFRFEGDLMLLLDRIVPSQRIVQTDPDQPGEDYRIRLFKDYFNPTSLESYKDFFLPNDWFGLSPSGFTEWQQNIAVKKLQLQQILHLQDQQKNEFLVIQYSMESQEYSVYQSTEFKKTPLGWKHTNIQNDPQAAFLMRLGSLNLDADERTTCMPGKIIDLDVLQANHIRTYTEKFDRADVFRKIETYLVESGLGREDIELAKTYFLVKDDQAFVEHLSGQFKVDYRKLIESINSSAGFELLRFSKNLND